MTTLGRLLAPRPSSKGGRLGNPDTLSWLDQFLSARSVSGKRVTVDGSVALPAVWSAMRLLTDAIGVTPLRTYERKPDGGSVEAVAHPSYRLLNSSPNPEMSATLLWRIVLLHLNSWGNAFLGKTFEGNQVVELWPIRPDRVSIERKGGVKYFHVRDKWGRITTYTSAEVLHIQGISFDGLQGISPIEAAAEAIGAGIAMDEYTNLFFANGAVPRLVIQGDKSFEDTETGAKLAAEWKAKYGGRNQHGVAVLEDGFKVEKISFPLKDLMLVEQQQWTAGDVCRVFRVPPSRMGITSGDSMTYKNVESDSLDFLTYSMLGWNTLIEQSVCADRDIFPFGRRQPNLYCEFDTDAFLRVDSKTRAEIDQIATGKKAWEHPSEVRKRRGMPADDSFDQQPEPPAAPPPIDEPA